jgi:type III secretion system chaperone SycN
MSDLDDLPAAFGESLGLGALRWSDRDTLSLAFESGETLGLERRIDRQQVLVYVARAIEVGVDADAVMQEALRLCHYGRGLPVAVRPGLAGRDRLVFLLKLPFADATLPALNERIELLLDLQRRAFGA